VNGYRGVIRQALGLFTVVPGGGGGLTRDGAVRAVRCLPPIGAGLGAVSALPLTAIEHWVPRATLLGSVAAIGLLALLTRGLHLDGLADTADGLGSRATPERALEIMRRSDIGPFGVVTVALVLLVDIAALSGLGFGPWRPVCALAVAAATGRLAVLFAARRSVPSARESGFGAFVAGSVGPVTLLLETALVLGFAAGMAASIGRNPLVWDGVVLGALVVLDLLRRHTTRRLGGVSGDVFGALVELGTALTVAALALS
jgi:adenosylcobinamide-GDP ribazoletransferase